MPGWATEKVVLPALAAVGGFVLGIFGEEIKSRVVPPETNAVISDVHFLPNVTLRDYLKSIGKPLGNRTRAELARTGAVVFATVRTTGFKGDELTFHASVERQIGIGGGVGATESPLAVDSRFKPTANKAVDSPESWVGDPCADKEHQVLVLVADKKKTIARKPGGAFDTSCLGPLGDTRSERSRRRSPRR